MAVESSLCFLLPACDVAMRPFSSPAEFKQRRSRSTALFFARQRARPCTGDAGNRRGRPPDLPLLRSEAPLLLFPRACTVACVEVGPTALDTEAVLALADARLGSLPRLTFVRPRPLALSRRLDVVSEASASDSHTSRAQVSVSCAHPCSIGRLRPVLPSPLFGFAPVNLAQLAKLDSPTESDFDHRVASPAPTYRTVASPAPHQRRASRRSPLPPLPAPHKPAALLADLAMTAAYSSKRDSARPASPPQSLDLTSTFVQGGGAGRTVEVRVTTDALDAHLLSCETPRAATAVYSDDAEEDDLPAGSSHRAEEDSFERDTGGARVERSFATVEQWRTQQLRREPSVAGSVMSGGTSLSGGTRRFAASEPDLNLENMTDAEIGMLVLSAYLGQCS